MALAGWDGASYNRPAPTRALLPRSEVRAMSQMIHKPDTNPIFLALMNLFLFGGVGYLVMGQTKKGVMSIVGTFLLSCLGIGIIVPWIAAYDAYLLGQKLAAGESIGMNENGLDFLDAIFKD